MKMKLSAAVGFMLVWALGATSDQGNGSLAVREDPQTGDRKAIHLHSRRKRYIVFPKGSSLQLLLEVLVHVPTRFRVVVGPTMQVAWPLPSDPSEGVRSRRSSAPPDVFRFKSVPREKTLAGSKFKLFGDLASLLDLFGMTVGLAWQLPDDPMIYSEFKKKHKMYKRSVFKKMEAFMQPNGANGRQCVLKALCESGQRTPLKKEFLKEILHKIFSFEREEEDFEENEEDKAYKRAHDSINQNCETLYSECQFSLFKAIQ